MTPGTEPEYRSLRGASIAAPRELLYCVSRIRGVADKVHSGVGFRISRYRSGLQRLISMEVVNGPEA